jgi:hypothetical protein
MAQDVNVWVAFIGVGSDAHLTRSGYNAKIDQDWAVA